MKAILRTKSLKFQETKTPLYRNTIVSSEHELNRRMPNCTTVVQTASDLIEHEIRRNSPKK